jgi:hypothetical protein
MNSGSCALLTIAKRPASKADEAALKLHNETAGMWRPAIGRTTWIVACFSRVLRARLVPRPPRKRMSARGATCVPIKLSWLEVKAGAIAW